MEMVTLFSGISSFVITGTDDLLVLIMFYMMYKTRFKEVVFGTLIGLIAVMIPSFIFAKLLASIDVSKYISTEVVLALVLGYIAFGLIQSGFSGSEEEAVDNLDKKTSFQVITASGVTYFLNGLDDFVVYSGFYLKYDTLKEISLFSFGIILGLVFFALISAYAGKKFLEFGDKFQNKIKVCLGGVILFFATFLLFHWRVGVNSTFFLTFFKNTYY